MKDGFDPDITNPDISLPETAQPTESTPENPLEALLDLDQKIAGFNEFLVGRTIVYGGMRIKVDKLDFDLSIVGQDENGTRVVVSKEDLRNFEIVDDKSL